MSGPHRRAAVSQRRRSGHYRGAGPADLPSSVSPAPLVTAEAMAQQLAADDDFRTMVRAELLADLMKTHHALGDHDAHDPVGPGGPDPAAVDGWRGRRYRRPVIVTDSDIIDGP